MRTFCEALGFYTDLYETNVALTGERGKNKRKGRTKGCKKQTKIVTHSSIQSFGSGGDWRKYEATRRTG
jgi:hypothetical protein